MSDTFPSSSIEAIAFEIFKRSPDFTSDPVKAYELYITIRKAVSNAKVEYDREHGLTGPMKVV